MRLLAYLQLVRLPNVFTAMADVTMGYLLVHQSLSPAAPFLCLLAGSSLLYMSGMVLNDLYDISVDAEERPERPLPSGRVSLRQARWLGYGMLVGGLIMAALAGLAVPPPQSIWWRPPLVGVLLAGSILLYDALLKPTLLGPPLMGGCRFFNVLLGMSAAPALNNQSLLIGYGRYELLVAGGIGVYILGVTLFSRAEARQSGRGALSGALAVMALGLLLLGVLPNYYPSDVTPNLDEPLHWWLLLALLALPVLRRCLRAIANPAPRQVQSAVKYAIISLILLDAALVAQGGGEHGPYWALLILSLLVPTLVLGRWVYST